MFYFNGLFVVFSTMMVVNAAVFKPASLDELRKRVDTCVDTHEQASHGPQANKLGVVAKEERPTQVHFGIISTARISHKVAYLQTRRITETNALGR